MYWPTGTPNVYALSKQSTSRTRLRSSSDGLNNENDDRGTGSSNGTSAHTNSREGFIPNVTSLNPTVEEPTPNDERITGRGSTLADENTILSADVSRGGSIFASITNSILTVWQAKPTLPLASIKRSPQSMRAYGSNVALLIRPDALVIVVQTSQNYLILYSVAVDPNARVYQIEQPNTTRHARRSSVDGYGGYRKGSLNAGLDAAAGSAEGDGFQEVNLRFRLVMRIDAGINKALALEDELVIATQKPAALQCIRWPSSDKPNAKLGPQTSTELIGKIPWIVDRCSVLEMVHDRPMNLSCWITSNGRAYAVQRRSSANVDMDNPASLFQGYCFHEPYSDQPENMAVKVAVNARFSLIAVACASGAIHAYVVKDYTGNIPLSHKVELSATSAEAGALQCLTFSPDGYCLFAGYEHGWVMWSVYGKLTASTFSQDRAASKDNDESWLQGIKNALWTGGGCELILLGIDDDRLWSIDLARSAATTCFTPANLLRGSILCSNTLRIYKGHEVPNPMDLSSDLSLWQTVQIPTSYLTSQWPIRAGVISADGKYIAVAGRRGLAHYSTVSGRWRVFDDP